MEPSLGRTLTSAGSAPLHLESTFCSLFPCFFPSAHPPPEVGNSGGAFSDSGSLLASPVTALAANPRTHWLHWMSWNSGSMSAAAGVFCFSRSCFYSFTIMLTVLNLYLKSWITTWVPHFAIQASTEHVHSSPADSFNHVNWDSLPCLPDLGSPPLSSVLINGTTSTQLFKPETWNYLRPFLLPDFQHLSGTQILFSSHKFWLVSAFLLLLLDFRAPIPRVFHNSPVITSLYFSCN